ncbi:hypothetical protein [Streptomyces sp. R44]|uniref:Uncharacterized protein n=1 Tax=Streptomyces sp. R44 TaxID=3238633 RepID=A0AB39T7G5_9ACTN
MLPRRVIADGFKDVFVQGGGARAVGLSEVQLRDIAYLDVEY